MSTGSRALRALAVAGLAALVFETHVVVGFQGTRAKIVPVPLAAADGSIRVTTSGFPEAERLRPPFALIARIKHASAADGSFSVFVDGVKTCERRVPGGAARRVDCVVTGGWNQAPSHEVVIRGTAVAWTLEYLELATHHGSNTGSQSFFILPGGATAYAGPGLGWSLVLWLALTGVLVPPAPRLKSRLVRWTYRAAAGTAVLALAMSQCSQWISDYRVVLASGTFLTWLAVPLAPRLWAAGRRFMQTVLSLGPDRIARVIDPLVVVLLLSAYAIAASGGGRWEVFGLRLSVSSPSRTVLLAGLLVLLRRWRAPREPLHPWIRAGLKRWSSGFATAESPDAATGVSPESAPLPGAALSAWRGEWAAVILLFVGLTLAMAWQQVVALYAVSDIGDPLFSVWRLSWVAHQLPRDPLHLFDANMFFPELRTLAYSDAMLATALLAAPLLWLGVHQVVVYNVVFLLSFAASGVAMYALVRELTGDRGAALVAGVAFAFYPFRFEHYSHLELQVTFWMPLALLMLHRTMKSGRVRDGAAAGAVVALQALSSLYFGLFLLVVMAVVWVSLGGWRPRGGRRVLPWMAAAVVMVVMVAPVAVPYLQNRGQLGERADWEARLYSATPRSYVVAHTRSRVYANLLDGPRMPEASLFPGIAVVALALVGAWPRVTRVRAAYLVAALVAFDGSLGMNGILFPTLRDYIMPFRGLRVPARFSILVGLSLSVLAGYGVHRLRQSPKLKGRLALAVPVACAAVLLAENVPNLPLTPVPAQPPLIYDYFKGAPASVLVDLPFPDSVLAASTDSRWLYYSTFHWQKLINGNSGYFPESFMQAIRMLRGAPTARAVTFLQDRGVEYIALSRAECADWQYLQWIEYLDQDPRVQLVRRLSGSRHDASLYRVLPR